MKLDLKVLAEQTLDLTMPSGEVLSLKKPSKGLLVEINKADMELLQTEGFENILNVLEGIVLKVLTNNTEGKKFTGTTLEREGIDYTLQQAIFKGYMAFIMEVSNNPN